MKININVVIGILLVLVIIYIVYNKKQEVFTGSYPNLTPELEAQLDEVIGSCFEEMLEPKPISVSGFLTKELLTNPTIKEEILLKLDELIVQPLYGVSKTLRIIAIDYKCGNSNGDTILKNTFMYLLNVVKSLTIVFREIYDIASDTPLPTLTFDDEQLFTQIVCLRKKYLTYDDPKILTEYDLENFTIDQTSSAYTFTTKLYEFIVRLAVNQSTDECLNVDMTQESNVLPSYTYFDGSTKTCNATSATPSQTSSGSTPSQTSSGSTPSQTSTGSTPSQTSSGSTPSQTSTGSTPSQTSTGSTPSQTSSGSTPSQTSTGSTPSQTSSGATPSSPSATTSASPSQTSSGSRQTVIGYSPNIFGSSYSNVTPAPFSLHPNINLVNATGPNNFFLPNIRIS